MSKFKIIILTIFIALLGIGFEVLNYYIYVRNDERLYKIGIATAGLCIVFISIFYYYLDKKKGKRK